MNSSSSLVVIITRCASLANNNFHHRSRPALRPPSSSPPFHQRPNFYSAAVHLAQSSLSLMVRTLAAVPAVAELTRIADVSVSRLTPWFRRSSSTLSSLFRGSSCTACSGCVSASFGPSRLSSFTRRRGLAVTGPALAMTIFREEVGAFFLVMFAALVTGRVWGLDRRRPGRSSRATAPRESEAVPHATHRLASLEHHLRHIGS